MLNSVHTGRQLAQRAVIHQVIATVLVALAWLIDSPNAALGALVGGFGVAAGFWIAGKVTLGGGIASAGVAFARMIMGVAARWVVVLLVLVMALAVLGLPGLPVVTGLLGATLGMVSANRFNGKVLPRE